MITYEKIKNAIDTWDPIDLLHFAPKDEYDFEIKRIMSQISIMETEEHLGKTIYKVFMDSFGENTFLKPISECTAIAKEILSK